MKMGILGNFIMLSPKSVAALPLFTIPFIMAPTPHTQDKKLRTQHKYALIFDDGIQF